jgi:hypothetical protein
MYEILIFNAITQRVWIGLTNRDLLTYLYLISTMEHIWRLCKLWNDEGPYKRRFGVALVKKWKVRYTLYKTPSPHVGLH